MFRAKEVRLAFRKPFGVSLQVGSVKSVVWAGHVDEDGRPGGCVMRRIQGFFAPAFVIVVLLSLPGVLLADVTGSILGVVRDPSSAVVKGAKVRVTNTETNLSQQTVTA